MRTIMNGIKISKITFLIAACIILSSSFTKQLTDYIKGRIGVRGFIAVTLATLGLATVSFLIFRLKNKTRLYKTLLSVAVVAIGIALTMRVALTVEKVHLFEYAILGWWSGKDFIQGEGAMRKARDAAYAFLVCALVGIADELFQALLPYRVCAISDMALNAAGGAWGVILCFLNR